MIEPIVAPKNFSPRCECLVVGSGAGGSLAAWYLSKHGKDVLVIEEGPFLRRMAGAIGATAFMPVLWREGGAIPIWGNANFVFAEGRCLGGSTMINAALINRLDEETVSSWAERFKIADFSYAAIMRYHNAIERALGVRNVGDASNVASRLFREGAEKCGLRGSEVPAAIGFDKGAPKKNDMLATHLRDAVKFGARVIADCRIEKILFNGGAANAARAVYSSPTGEKRQFLINFDQLFVCGGALQTPLLLRRSGVTNNIGDTVLFHPTLRVAAEFGVPIHAYSSLMSGFQIKEFSPEINMGISLPLPPFLAAAVGPRKENNQYRENLDRMALYYVMVKPHAAGKVRNIPLLDGGYAAFYRFNRQDVRNLSFGFAKLCEVLLEAGAVRLYPSIEGFTPIQSKKHFNRYLREDLSARKLNLISIHAFSSCPMGENKEFAATDSYGKIHGFKNIYVVDASVLPGAPGVNPQGPLMAIALRNLEKNFP